MIRTFAALAALAVVPTVAAAQTYAPSTFTDPSAVTVLGQRPDSYAIVVNVAGKTPALVSREIWEAAYTACERAPLTGNAMDLRVESMQACVTQARWDASAQYRRILDRQGAYGRVYQTALR
ncbi:MAG TPA: hypothetical protein VL460_01160 [Caulobacteraceae bacterium]|jgi:hypothetical protein|nr:hypothetical protein [Caulobacteraceae bacterium]